jgi:hypothetical protein
MKTYSHHNCGLVHRTYQDLAGCMFLLPWQEWPALREGEYATLVYCRGLTVALHETLDKAQTALGLINSGACGDDCRNDHHLVRLVNPSLALRWPDRVTSPQNLLPLIGGGPYTDTMAATRP